ncbi:hypothetical protein ABENE_17350 [Asticcacaulis benevestitus DSM 16100 = ATCC BAA-896]|uniref:Uncharacterized protein n=2 Tax=Asticcacaulis TaxID=76890 RepID=V4PJ83_9CAUL|nr:hypothetical protein ABENE_17350 [Asticcacaulis benevestitus DSM 16100 = ATCC BAA-896]
MRFADKERIEHLDAKLYNCLDAFPSPAKYDCFYTNPPWGASNAGESVKVFTQRGMEAIGWQGEGLVVIADDNQLAWPQQVLARSQLFALENGFFVSKFQPKMHLYHLDDEPDLKSCNMFFRSVPGMNPPLAASEAITDPDRLQNFYGKSKEPRVHYVREKKRLD